MSAKTKLFELLNTFPSTVVDTEFPTLTVPDAPETVEGAILCNAKCSIEIVKFFNAFAGMCVRELFGSVGMLSPSAQAIAGGFLQADGSDISGASAISDAIKMIGDESSGGGLTGNNESLARRESVGGSLSLLSKIVELIPVVGDYADFLAPIINVAVAIYAKPGSIAIDVAEIIFANILDLIKQIIINELYKEEAPEGADPLVSESLANIAKALRTMDAEGNDADIPIGSLLQALQKRFSFTGFDIPGTFPDLPKGTLRQEEGMEESASSITDVLTQELDYTLWPENEEEEEYNVLVAIKEDMDEIAENTAGEGIVEIEGTRVWTHSKVIDEGD